MVTGRPRSPARWVAETSRQIAAQPALPVARNVARGSRSSRNAPPRTGVRGRRSLPGVREGSAYARSTPSTGRIPAARQALVNFTAP